MGTDADFFLSAAEMRAPRLTTPDYNHGRNYLVVVSDGDMLPIWGLPTTHLIFAQTDRIRGNVAPTADVVNGARAPSRSTRCRIWRRFGGVAGGGGCCSWQLMRGGDAVGWALRIGASCREARYNDRGL